MTDEPEGGEGGGGLGTMQAGRVAEMLNVDEFEGPWVRRPTDLLGGLSS
jgi:hypothetical protein